MRPSRHIGRTCGVVACFVFAIITPSLPAWADYWYEHYARAETALDNESWERAVEELQQALERKGDSGARVRSYGMKVVAYFPYLKLGIAYYHLGQVESALQAFQTEEQLGAIQASASDLAELERYRRLALEARAAAAGSRGPAGRGSKPLRDSLLRGGICRD